MHLLALLNVLFFAEDDFARQTILDELNNIHKTTISPVEALYKYNSFSDGSITGLCTVLFVIWQ